MLLLLYGPEPRPDGVAKHVGDFGGGQEITGENGAIGRGRRCSIIVIEIIIVIIEIVILYDSTRLSPGIVSPLGMEESGFHKVGRGDGTSGDGNPGRESIRNGRRGFVSGPIGRSRW